MAPPLVVVSVTFCPQSVMTLPYSSSAVMTVEKATPAVLLGGSETIKRSSDAGTMVIATRTVSVVLSASVTRRPTV